MIKRVLDKSYINKHSVTMPLGVLCKEEISELKDKMKDTIYAIKFDDCELVYGDNSGSFYWGATLGCVNGKFVEILHPPVLKQVNYPTYETHVACGSVLRFHSCVNFEEDIVRKNPMFENSQKVVLLQNTEHVFASGLTWNGEGLGKWENVYWNLIKYLLT